jgi:hypothetical protein
MKLHTMKNVDISIFKKNNIKDLSNNEIRECFLFHETIKYAIKLKIHPCIDCAVTECKHYDEMKIEQVKKELKKIEKDEPEKYTQKRRSWRFGK